MKYLLILFIGFQFLACTVEKAENLDTKKVLKEIKDRKIKQAHPKEIKAFAKAKGQEISKEVLEKSAHHQNVCDYADWKEKLTNNNKLILKISISCSEDFILTTAEKTLWNKYLEQHKNASAKLSEAITNLPTGEVLYTFPIIDNDSESHHLAMLSIVFSKKEIIRML